MEEMNHRTAVDTQAAERYLLDEMDSDEATAFEAHFFDCTQCGQTVRETAVFVDNARVALRQPESGNRRRWVRPILAAAAMLPLFVVLYQNTVTIPKLQMAARPQAVTATVLRVVRAALPVVELKEDAARFALVVDLISPDRFPSYRAEFRSDEGRTVATIEMPPPSETGSLHLDLPAGSFPEGAYEMRLLGLGSVPGTPPEVLETYVFRVQRQGKGGNAP